VDFTSSKPNVTLTTPGVYLLTAVSSIKSATSGTNFEIRLFNTTTALPVTGTVQFTASTNPRTVSLTAILTTSAPNEVVRLEAYGKNGTVYAVNTTITFVQLS
jgi:hypothetical protein